MMEGKSEFLATSTEPAPEQNDSTENEVRELIEEIRELQEKNSRQLTQVLRENINFQNQVRQGMYEELENLKETQRGEQFTPILKSIATICVEYRNLLDDETIPRKARKALQLLFDELEDILAEYDAEIFRSNVGDQRRNLFTKIINTFPTTDKSRHNTVAKSRRPGVVRNGKPLYREFIDVYVYNPENENGQPKSEFARSE